MDIEKILNDLQDKVCFSDDMLDIGSQALAFIHCKAENERKAWAEGCFTGTSSFIEVLKETIAETVAEFKKAAVKLTSDTEKTKVADEKPAPEKKEDPEVERLLKMVEERLSKSTTRTCR